MATLREITESIIEDIEYVLKLAGPLASGDPIPDTSIYHLDDFPEAGWKAQEAYDMAVSNDEIKDTVQTLIEASDRLSAVYTMLCDLIPSRDARNYDFYTVAAILPYLTFTLDALGEIKDELHADMEIADAKPCSLHDNTIYKRIFSFVAESLADRAKRYVTVAGFRVYAMQQLRKFSLCEAAEPFEFSFSGVFSTLSCRFDGELLEVSNMVNDAGNCVTTWNLTIGRNGDIYGNMDTDDLENIEGMSLSIDEPEEYCYNEKEDN